MAKMGTASEAELLLYRVLQRANLTQYYETFIQQGGDDIRQLCEAGEEEFLEIMALVGMAAKPLHVRRLQKALQEWVTNPVMFEKPIGPCTPPPAIASGSIVSTMGRPPSYVYPTVRSSTPSRSDSNPTPPEGWIPNPDSRSSSPNPTAMTTVSQAQSVDTSSSEILMQPVFVTEPAPIWKSPVLSNLQGPSSSTVDLTRNAVSPTPSSDSDTNVMMVTSGSSTASVPMQIPTLTEQQQLSIETACETLANELPTYEPKPLNMKKDTNRDIDKLMKMPDDHPDKMTLLRKFSAIYGRFDSKRKNDTKMSLHEVSVNEAAAQLCKRIPALLTRRDDLYPLSRRAVRDSGYQYSKGHSRAASSMDIPPNKKQRTDNNAKKALTFISAQHEVRISEINKEIDYIIKKQEDIKTKMATARSKKDTVWLEALQQQLEKCASRQLKLRMEQSGIIGSGRNKALPKSQPESNTVLLTPVQLSQPESSANKPPGGDSAIIITPDSSSSTSLLDEGLLFAQKYGMCDLAEELKYMKDDSKADESDNSEVDEQEEWNRLVDKDLEKLNSPSKDQASSDSSSSSASAS